MPALATLVRQAVLLQKANRSDIACAMQLAFGPSTRTFTHLSPEDIAFELSHRSVPQTIDHLLQHEKEDVRDRLSFGGILQQTAARIPSPMFLNDEVSRDAFQRQVRFLRCVSPEFARSRPPAFPTASADSLTAAKPGSQEIQT